MSEEVYLCSTHNLHLHLTGNEEYIKIFCYKIPVHFHFGGKVRDRDTSGMPLKELLESIYSLQIENRHTLKISFNQFYIYAILVSNNILVPENHA